MVPLEQEYEKIMESKEVTKEVVKSARSLRLKLKGVRVDIEKRRKKGKEKPLLECKAIDGIGNSAKAVIIPMEKGCEEKEKFFEIQEKLRIDNLNIERSEKLQEYELEVIPGGLGEMDDSVWVAYLTGVKTNYNAKIEAKKKAEEQRIEDEKKAEAERVETVRIQNLHNERKNSILKYWAHLDYNVIDKNFGEFSEAAWESLVRQLEGVDKRHKEKQEKTRIENERLKKEFEELEKKRIEKAKVEAERKTLGEKRQSLLFNINVKIDFDTCADMPIQEWTRFFDFENDKYQKEQIEIKKRIKKEQDDRRFAAEKLRKEQKAKEALKAQIKAKKEAEEQSRIQKIADEKKMLAAPDKEKLLVLAEYFKNTQLPELKTEEANEINRNIKVLIVKLCDYIKSQANKL